MVSYERGAPVAASGRSRRHLSLTAYRASCATRAAHSVFTSHGLADGCESQANGVVVKGLSESQVPSLIMVGAASSFLHELVPCLELIALPGLEDFEQPRGEVTGFPSTAKSPCRLCDSTLELRLGGKVSLQTDLELDASSPPRTLQYRGTSLIRNSADLGPYSRTTPRALWWP